MLEISTTHRAELRRLGEQLVARATHPLEVLMATGVLVEQRPPEPADSDWAADLARELAARGTSLQATLAAIDSGQRTVWEACTSSMGRGRDSAKLLAAVGSVLLSWHGAAMAAAAEAFREVEQPRHAVDRDRAGALRAVLIDGGDAASITGLSAHGGTAVWRALRARPIPPATATAVEQALEPTLKRSGGLVATVADEVFGVVSAAPRIRRETAYVGLGPAVDADGLQSSFATATRVLEAAVALHAPGVTSMEGLRLRIAVAESQAVGDEVVRRCLGPLAAMGSFGRSLHKTLRAYVDTGARVEPTAEALGVHPNTVRHRLRRYEDAAGLHLARVEDLVELWWALEREGLASGPAAAA